MELLGLLGLLALGLAAYGLLLGRRVIESRVRGQSEEGSTPDGKDDNEKLGACCGFGLPPMGERKPN